ncbi:activating signal cointegrator 1 complex subunit 1-like isoform X2 [Actinia tenebrosa]|nr:activating signal cointegrator 1 complex subunit 1-like isoform X2 [Actinia tenebrosa]
MNYEDETCDASDVVEETKSGFRTVMDTPSALFKFVIGRKAETKKKIEMETDTRLFIPSQGQAGDIVITGPSRSGVLSARRQVEVIAESSRQKCSFTHFLSFPLYFDELATKAEEFKESVLQKFSQTQGIHPSIFQKPCKLHLTIGMLVLLNQEEVDNAAQFLSSCYKDLIRECLHDKPISIKLEGLEIMNDDPSSVSVLYARVNELDGKQRLQHLADSIVQRFVDHGIMQHEYDKVKLHATVMNSSMHSDLEEIARRNNGRKNYEFNKMRRKYAFDAREILQVFEDINFGQYHLKEIHISERGKYDEHGRYYCAASVSLP